MTEGIVASLIASALFFLLGLSVARARREWHLRIFSNIWAPLIRRGEVKVVLSTRPGPHPRSTPRVSLNEMNAFVKISETLKSLGCIAIAVDSNRRLEDLQHDNLVLLGGPAANDITAEIWHRVESKLPFRFDLPRFSISISDRSYICEEDKEGRLTKDFALLVRVSDSIASGCKVLLCSGCHGYGTWGAVLACTDRLLVKKISKSINKEQDFCALLEMDIRLGAVSPPRVRELFLLP